MPDGSPLPPELFEFTHEEMALAPHMLELLTPEYLKNIKLPHYIPSSTASSSTTTTGDTGDGGGGGGGFLQGSRTSL